MLANIKDLHYMLANELTWANKQAVLQDVEPSEEWDGLSMVTVGLSSKEH